MSAPRPWLAAADSMLAGSETVGAVAVSEGWWPKACACLIRLALEEGIDEFCPAAGRGDHARADEDPADAAPRQSRRGS